MSPPTWTQVVEAAPGRLLIARLKISERISLAGLIVQPVAPGDERLIEQARVAAQGADPAVVVVGLTPEQETEALDKKTLALPGRQDDLVCAVADSARRTVVVINAATPVLMPWLDRVDAVLWVGLPGQEGGHAITDVLLGRTEATGRLVTTFPAADGDGPAWGVSPENGGLDYAEGTRVGYRGWYGSDVEPAFWFGAGLGWGIWDYRSASTCEMRAASRSRSCLPIQRTARPARWFRFIGCRTDRRRYDWSAMPWPMRWCPARSVRSP
jgi:beta-glucosidase